MPPLNILKSTVLWQIPSSLSPDPDSDEPYQAEDNLFITVEHPEFGSFTTSRLFVITMSSEQQVHCHVREEWPWDNDHQLLPVQKQFLDMLLEDAPEKFEPPATVLEAIARIFHETFEPA